MGIKSMLDKQRADLENRILKYCNDNRGSIVPLPAFTHAIGFDSPLPPRDLTRVICSILDSMEGIKSVPGMYKMGSP